MSARASAIFVLLMLGLAGCASGPDRTPRDEAIVEASEEVLVGVEVGATSANERPGYRVLLRHNPSRCPCPDYEIFVFGAWERVWIDGSEAALARVEAFRDSGEQRTMAIRGVLTTERRPSERQVVYPVFEIE